MRTSIFLNILLCLGCLGLADAQNITLSTDGKYLVDGTAGRPVFITGDAAWSLIVQLDDAQTITYLRDRSARGYNAILVELIEHQYSDTPCAVGRGDHAGNCPFKGAPFSTPNEAYFAHADYVMQQAKALGFTVFLCPTFGGYKCGAEGWCAEIQAASETVMANWGAYVGTRYKDYPVVWVIGNDLDPETYGVKSKLNAFAVALRKSDPNHLITAEGYPFKSALDIWAGFPWLGINTEYGGDSTTTGKYGAAQFQRADFLPFLLIESSYEGEYSNTGRQTRVVDYSAVLNGAYLGAIFGNNPIWCFNETNPASQVPCNSKTTWQSQLSSTGSVGHAWFGKLFRSREHWKLVPDLNHTVVTGGYGTESIPCSTARTSDGQSIISYIPMGNATALTVDMAKITDAQGGAQVWWFDPATGDVTNGGKFPNHGIRTFTPPNSNDWVLIIDAASAKLPLPGR